MDSAAACLNCVAAAGPAAPWQAALKAFSLGYLISLPALALAAWGWRLLRQRLAPQQRANAGSAALLICAALQPLLGAGIWYGVVTHQILMTTNYFHHLMYGGWSQGITGAGLIVMGVSLLVAAWSWRRAQPPRRLANLPRGWDEHGMLAREAQAFGLRLYPASGVATAALTGVLRPALLVNPAYWESLSAAQRELALTHEREHLRRNDNLLKLVLESIALLYGLLPGVRRWVAGFELDSELAVDDACRQRGAEGAYRALIGESVQWAMLSGPAARRQAPALASGAVSQLSSAEEPRSALSQADLLARLAALSAAGGQRRGRPSVAVSTCAGLSLVPTLLLLAHPVPRCLLACYLGY